MTNDFFLITDMWEF